MSALFRRLREKIELSLCEIGVHQEFIDSVFGEGCQDVDRNKAMETLTLLWSAHLMLLRNNDLVDDAELNEFNLLWNTLVIVARVLRLKKRRSVGGRSHDELQTV